MKYKAIICDIDGTLAHMNGRSPYDPTLYHEDTVDEVVREIVNFYEEQGYWILIVSGRFDTYFSETLTWISKNEIKWDGLYMRKEGDKREDSIIKREIYEEQIKDKYDVRFVLDDRNRVVKMWRELGLKCLQVAEGNF